MCFEDLMSVLFPSLTDSQPVPMCILSVFTYSQIAKSWGGKIYHQNHNSSVLCWLIIIQTMHIFGAE